MGDKRIEYAEKDISDISIWRRIASCVWDTAAKSPAEQKLVNKLDLSILTYVMFSYLIKALDNNNIQNAYVSGMKEDLGLYGQELNLFTTFYNIGFIVGSLPSQIAMTVIRPSLFIPCCEIVWTVFVMLISLAKNAKLIYGMRFFIGLGESVCFPGFARVVGSWYKPEELAKRQALFDVATSLATMISGYIQAGVYTSLNGVHGLAGWRWLFIIDGVISLPVGVMGFLMLPDYPTTTKVKWLTEDEKALGIARMEAVGRKAPRKLTIGRFLTMWIAWKPWLFTIALIFAGMLASVPISNYMSLWLKSLDYSVQAINILPTIGSAIAMVFSFVFAVFNDLLHWRVQAILVTIFFPSLGFLILGIWNIPFGLKFFAYLIPRLGNSLGSFLLVWSTEIFQDDAEMRGLLPGLSNGLLFAITSWLPLLIFPTPKAPRFPIGFYCSMGWGILSAIFTLITTWYHRYDIRRRGLAINKYGLIYVPEEANVMVAPDDIDLSEQGYQGKKETVVSAIEV
ncbi:major facilitator superfamily domain-containing protein [Dipodascopsis uninucleata]